MAISDELNRIILAKAGIRSALAEKGLTIGDSSTLDEYPALILEMETGGGVDTSTLIDLIEGDILELVIPEGITKIGQSAFQNRKQLSSVTIPSNISNIDMHAFAGCTALHSLDLPAACTTIYNGLVRDCVNLEKFVIKAGVTAIWNEAFYNVSPGMSMAMLPTTPPTLYQTGNYIFGGSWPIYVKSSAVNTYKNAGGNWNNVSTRILALAAIDYDSSTMTVTASGRDNLELYIDASLCGSSVYTFTPGTEDSSHVITVKSVDSSLGVLDLVSLEILIEGEIDYSTLYFGISALADSSIGINTLKTDGELLYSEDQENWTQWDYANETLDLLTGETLYFKGNNGGHPCVWDKPLFNITGSVNLHGNISSILWGDDYLTNNTIGDGGMAYAFKNSTAIINCKNLIMAPTYKACYEGCFYNCTNLITAPLLPSLSPAQRAYNSMFSYCTSLTTAPELPALSFPANGYNMMFSGCTNLNNIKAMFTNTPNTVGTLNWVKNVSSTGTFVMNAAAEWDPEEYRGVHGIPEGWTVEKVTA